MEKDDSLTPLSGFPSVLHAVFPPCGDLPNSRFPVIVYRQSMPGAEAESFETRLASRRWRPSWRNGIFAYQHYHSTAHEFLGCYAGWAEVRLGGECGVDLRIERGDAVLIPAGVGHQCLSRSRLFSLVGAYPGGQYPDLLYGGAGELAPALRNIESLALPQEDPVYEDGGPLLLLWTRA